MGNKKTRKTVPKEFISLFRVHSGRDAPRRDTREVQKVKSMGLDSLLLPDLPVASNALQELLLEYGLLNDIKWDSKGLKASKKQKTKLKPLILLLHLDLLLKNYFQSEHQRELSSKLADVWTQESNQEVWKQYTQSYNNYLLLPDAKLNFVDWLCEALDYTIDNTTPQIEDILLTSYNQLLSGTIEDVYIMK